jgi:ketosteroid isomerase-like protein
MPDDATALRAWFEALQDCVQRVDFEGGRRLFAEDAIGFGTKASLAVGRDTLEASQWRGIWPNIRDFHFNLGDLRWGASGGQAWAIATWGSTGFDRDGKPYDRPGRATVIFRRENGRWLAIHSHFSLYPGTPPTTHGPTGA